LGNDTEYLDKPIENLKNELADLEQVERKVVPPHILLSRTQQKIRHLEAREKKLTQDRNYWDQTIQEANTKIQDANVKKQEAIDTYSDNEDRLQELRNAQKHQVEQAAGDDSNATPRCSYAPERPAFLTAEEMQLPDLFKVCLKAVCINYWPKPLALSQPGNGPRCPPSPAKGGGRYRDTRDRSPTPHRARSATRSRSPIPPPLTVEEIAAAAALAAEDDFGAELNM